jgi:hypothetical protein
MWVFVAVMIATALWIVFGAVLHGSHEPARDTGGDAWWTDSGHPSPRLVAWIQGPGGPGGQA